MTSADFVVLLPLVVLAASAVLLTILIGIRRSHRLTGIAAHIGLIVAFATLWPAWRAAPRQVTPLLIADHYALFYIGLIIGAAFVVVLLAYHYFEPHSGRAEEFYVLLLIATLGSATLAASCHFGSFFLSIEILSISLFVLIAYLPEKMRPLEAGLKYLVLASVASAFLAFGMALIYAEIGTMEFGRMSTLLDGGLPGLALPGVVLIITGFGFKLAVVPFHLWTPDVYEGAPAPVTTFIATVSKGGVLAILLRYFYSIDEPAGGPIATVFSVIAVASMFAGNLLALLQNNVKRILAYSSIAHLGYIMVGFQARGVVALEAVTFYIVAYIVTLLGAFGIVTVLSGRDRDADAIADYRGLFWRRPWLAAVFSAMLLSLAGIPLTAGFLAKFYILAAGATESLWILVISLVVSSVIGLYYYLRVLIAMYSRDGDEAPALPRVSAEGGFALLFVSILLIWFGVSPGGMLALIRSATGF